ncbi:MAG: hypothetical protein AAF318_05800 [Pseudomonadota bacterium]
MPRILAAATMLSFGTVAFLALAVPRLATGFEERAIRADLQAATSGDILSDRTLAAVAEGDIDGAEQYRALGQELFKPISPEATAALDEANGTLATIVRNASDFAGAYITGHADNAAGLAGAVVSDLTVVGDVRDIISEGGKAAVGEDYSEFLLALAAVGLAAEGVTIATGGTSLVLKAGISVLKVAKRTGNLTAEFSARLVGLAKAAARRADGPPPAAAGAVEAARAAAGLATGPARMTRSAARAELAATLGAVNTMAGNAGASNAVRLMRFVRTGADAARIAEFTGRFARRSRVVAELTGKVALRSFRLGVRGLRLLFAFLYSFIAWLVGLVLIRAVRRALQWTLDVMRGAVLRFALP